jgi:hypothetical protein
MDFNALSKPGGRPMIVSGRQSEPTEQIKTFFRLSTGYRVSAKYPPVRWYHFSATSDASLGGNAERQQARWSGRLSRPERDPNDVPGH